jgi:hypothetical protein
MLGERTYDLHESINYMGAIFDISSAIYANLRYLEMNDVVEQIENCLIDDPQKADDLLLSYGMMLEPIFGGLRAHRNTSLSRLKHLVQPAKISELNKGTSGTMSDERRYPVDIGRFLMKKIAPNASDYQACKYVIDNYKDNDLYKVLNALDKGIKDQSKDAVVKDVAELDMIMDNIWKDSQRLSRSGKVIEGGIEIAIGLVGFGLTSSIMPSVGFLGFLSSLGLKVAENYTAAKNIGDKVAKLVNKDYITNVYDFTKKYPLAR